jgi:carbonic anhydrase
MEESENMAKTTVERKRRGYDELLQGNRDWVNFETERDPDYFKRLAAGQEPDVL